MQTNQSKETTTENAISEAGMIARTIFYSPATNGKAQESIANGEKLIEQYGTDCAHQKQQEFVRLVEGMRIEPTGANYTDGYNQSLTDLLNQINK